MLLALEEQVASVPHGKADIIRSLRLTSLWHRNNDATREDVLIVLTNKLVLQAQRALGYGVLGSYQANLRIVPWRIGSNNFRLGNLSRIHVHMESL